MPNAAGRVHMAGSVPSAGAPSRAQTERPRRALAAARRVGVCVSVLVIAGMLISASAAASGRVVAWGFNYYGELGNGTTTTSDVPVAANLTLPGGVTVTAVSAGTEFSLALLSNHTVMAWGSNVYGELGNGTLGPEVCGSFHCSKVPVTVCAVGTVGTCPGGPYLTEVTAISAGSTYSMALLKNGTVVTWGYDGSYQLGDGIKVQSEVPVPVCAIGATAPCTTGNGNLLSGVTEISAGTEYSLALLNNHTAVGWGANYDGQLGDGSTTDSDVPVGVCEVGWSGTCTSAHYQAGVTAVSAGSYHSGELLSNHTVISSGPDPGGELGNGATLNAAVPIPVGVCELGALVPCPTGPYLTGATAVSARFLQSVALVGGTAVAWGANSSGELGDNNTTTSDVPVGVCEVGWTSGSCTSGHYLTGVAGVSAGVEFSLALMSNETVTAWGEDPNGQLGDNATANSDVPVGVCEVGWTAGSCSPSHYLAGVTAISAGNGHSLAIAPAPAVPGPHWYKKGVELTKGAAHTSVATKGALVFGSGSGTITCKVTDTEEIWNPLGVGAGEDEITAFTFVSCSSHPRICPAHTSVEISPKGLPWLSHLVAGSPVRDEIENIKLEVNCSNHTHLYDLEGTLKPEVGVGVLNFGSGSGELEEPIGHTKVKVTGADKLTAPPGKITAM